MKKIFFFTILLLNSNAYSFKIKPLYINEKIFVNCRVSPITIKLIDGRDKQHQVTIKPGTRKTITYFTKQAKSSTCYSKYEKTQSVKSSRLNCCNVFVFNDQNKLEEYNFFDIKQKNKALRKAYNAGDKKLADKLHLQTTYLK